MSDLAALADALDEQSRQLAEAAAELRQLAAPESGARPRPPEVPARPVDPIALERVRRALDRVGIR